MGLDTTHDAWAGPYSAFNRWRTEIVRAAGYKVIDAHEDPTTHEWVYADYPDLPGWDEALTHDEVMGEWKRDVEEPLLYLLWHSDCDGKIKPKQARLIAKRLEEVKPNLRQLDANGSPARWDERTQRFIDGLRLAASKQQTVRFY